MLHLLKISLLGGLFALISQADVYTYQYSGASFDTECSSFNGCNPVSGVGALSGYVTLSQPPMPHQTVDLSSPLLLDWQLSSPFGFFGANAGGTTLVITAGGKGQIESWNLAGSASQCFGGPGSVFCEFEQIQSSSTGGDLFYSAFDIDSDSFSTAIPGAWTPQFVLTPEPAATPKAQLLLLLGTIAAIACIRYRPKSSPAPNTPAGRRLP